MSVIMVTRLIRSKMFDKYRYKGKYFEIVIDGTGIMSFKERHCKHCLKRTYKKGISKITNNNIKKK